jgi:hypothetical protein
MMLNDNNNDNIDHDTPDAAQGSPTSARRGRISIDQLVLDPAFQVRNKLNEQAIGKYKEAYRLDRQLDPIRVADVGGMLILVDGWHRVTALKQLGNAYVDAEIVPMSRDDALWAASIANAKHGVPLSKEEHVNVFRNYIATGRHIKDEGPTGITHKSYREIADELPINRSYGTIRNWMNELYPDIAKAMGGSSVESNERRKASHDSALDNNAPDTNAPDNSVPNDSVPQHHVKLVEELLRYFQSDIEPEERGLIITDVRSLLCTMENAPGWTDPPIEWVFC